MHATIYGFALNGYLILGAIVVLAAWIRYRRRLKVRRHRTWDPGADLQMEFAKAMSGVRQVQKSRPDDEHQ